MPNSSGLLRLSAATTLGTRWVGQGGVGQGHGVLYFDHVLELFGGRFVSSTDDNSEAQQPKSLCDSSVL